MPRPAGFHSGTVAGQGSLLGPNCIPTGAQDTERQLLVQLETAGAQAGEVGQLLSWALALGGSEHEVQPE